MARVGAVVSLFRKVLLGGLALLAPLVAPASASATSPYLEIPDKAIAEASPAYRYAHMTGEQALAELDRRKVPYRRLKRIAGVTTPVRLTGPLHGVSIHGALPAAQRVNSHFEIVDARFLLTLDDFAALLEKHDIVELVHFTMYRPNGPKPGSPEEKRYFEILRQREARARGDVPRKKSSSSKLTSSAKKKRAKKAAAKKAAAKKAASKRATTRRKTKRTRPKPATKTVRKAKPTRKKGKRSKGARPTKRKTSALPSLTNMMHALGMQDSKLLQASFADKANDSLDALDGLKAKKGRSKPVRKRRRVRTGAKRRPAKSRPKKVRKKLWAPPGTRHPAGLAIDVGYLVKRDGRRLSVAQHFHGKRGQQTCGANVPSVTSAEARELRSLVCEARDLGMFNYVLTPNYDRAHADHFHMEIRSGVRWFLYH